MAASIPPEAGALTEHLLEVQREALRDRRLAVYLFGSATTGSFQPGISDVDTVAVLATDPSDSDMVMLGGIHSKLIVDAPEWTDRVEVDYVSAVALANFRTGSWSAARISPGEPFHQIQIDQRWVLDWYQVLRSGVALYGPPPEEFIPPISHYEFANAVLGLLVEWPDRLTEDVGPGGLIYAGTTAGPSLADTKRFVETVVDLCANSRCPNTL